MLRFRYHLYRSHAPHRGGDFITKRYLTCTTIKKTAYDIDVDDNVKELIIPTDLKMNNTKKSFPSVKKLIIDALVVDIQIPNSLFPNVKNTKKCILKACCRPVFSFFLPCKIRHIKYETRYKNKERKREK